MCLDKVDSTPKIPKSDIGYKVMRRLPDGSLENQFYGEGKTYEVGETYKDRKRKPVESWLRQSNNYPTGFHIFLRPPSDYLVTRMRGEVVVKVQFANVVATGLQVRRTVVVARQIKILEALV